MTDKYKGVVEVEILGEKRGFKFGMACMAHLCKLEGITFSEFQKRMNENEPGTLLNFYFTAAIQYCKLFKIATEPTYEEVANWIDNMSRKQNDEIQEAFSQYNDPNK